MTNLTQVDLVLHSVRQEVQRSMQFPDINSEHEGWAVIKEELDELWEEVRAYPDADRNKMAKEAIHVAAL
ncbi:hypothetical protein LCGC14_0693730 [marine sediment metagenome]|uniref:Uncharacterized protein n=1 Tax=marine sediment metagenome TaxID=412755 RepID=A0A0F9R523_9ZZZZ